MGFTHYEQKVIDNLNDISKSLRKIASALEAMPKAEGVDALELATKVEEKILASSGCRSQLFEGEENGIKE